MHPFVLFRSRGGLVTHYGSAQDTSQGAKYPSQDCVLCNSATAHCFYCLLSGVRTFWNSEENLEKREPSNASSSSHRSSELEPRRSKLRPTGTGELHSWPQRPQFVHLTGGGNPQQKFYRTLTRCNKPYKTNRFDKKTPSHGGEKTSDKSSIELPSDISRGVPGVLSQSSEKYPHRVPTSENFPRSMTHG